MQVLEHEKTILNLDQMVSLRYSLGTMSPDLSSLDIYYVAVELKMANGDVRPIDDIETLRVLVAELNRNGESSRYESKRGLAHYVQKQWEFQKEVKDIARRKKHEGA